MTREATPRRFCNHPSEALARRRKAADTSTAALEAIGTRPIEAPDQCAKRYEPPGGVVLAVRRRASERADDAPAPLLRVALGSGAHTFPRRFGRGGPESVGEATVRESAIDLTMQQHHLAQFLLAGGDDGVPTRKEFLSRRGGPIPVRGSLRVGGKEYVLLLSLRHPRSIESPASVPILLIHQFPESTRRKSHRPTGAMPRSATRRSSRGAFRSTRSSPLLEQLLSEGRGSDCA
jgi:hypothetical protein